MRIYILFLLFIFCLVKQNESLNCDKTPKSAHARLMKVLLCDYDKAIRPIDNLNQPTLLRLDYVVKRFSFVSNDQSLMIDLWLIMEWTDRNFAWRPVDYDNIKEIQVSSVDIWLPDLSVYNSKNDGGLDNCQPVVCKILYTGQVICSPPCTHDAYCETNFKNWPFDVQTCFVHMGTWVSGEAEVAVNKENCSVYADLHVIQSEWKMIYTNFTIVPIVADEVGAKRPYIIYEFRIQRHSAFHLAMLVTPSFVLILINFIALWLEYNSKDRLLLFSLNFLLHFTYVHGFFWYIPFNGDIIPDVVLFFRDSLLTTSFLLLATVIIRSVASYQIPAPKWIDMTNNVLLKNPIVLFFKLNRNHEKSNGIIHDDGENLVESTNQKTIEENLTWPQFAKIVDRFVFVILILIYAILFFRVIPSSYETI